MHKIEEMFSEHIINKLNPVCNALLMPICNCFVGFSRLQFLY